jgi:drug/metabolite transporter (DMT)-like permease
VRTRDLVELVALGAIWGASFLFMRVAAPEFGPPALIFVRVSVAALLLTWALALRGGLRELEQHARALLVLGTLNSAVPFTLFAFSALTLSAGFNSVLNATTPLFGALVAYVWLRERLTAARALGLALGLAGATTLVWGKLAFGGKLAEALAVLAGLCAALGYGIAAHYSKRRLAGATPLAVAAGSQIASALVLLPFGISTWPAQPLSVPGIASAVVLGVACTGVAYLLYFRLIASLGPTRAITVTYLIPVFGVLWGGLFLGERPSPAMLVGGALILGGTTLVLRAPTRRPEASVRATPAPCSPRGRPS